MRLVIWIFAFGAFLVNATQIEELVRRLETMSFVPAESKIILREILANDEVPAENRVQMAQDILHQIEPNQENIQNTYYPYSHIGTSGSSSNGQIDALATVLLDLPYVSDQNRDVLMKILYDETQLSNERLQMVQDILGNLEVNPNGAIGLDLSQTEYVPPDIAKAASIESSNQSWKNKKCIYRFQFKEKYYCVYGKQINTKDACCICMDDDQNKQFQLSCKHSFCQSCIEKFSEMALKKGKVTCPTCREEISEEQKTSGWSFWKKTRKNE